MKRYISILLTILLISSIAILPGACINAAEAGIDYSFSKSDKGFAEGMIKLTADEGTYWLYWADDTKALDGYTELCSLTFESRQTLEHKMYERAAIPVDAKKLIAVKSDKEPADKTVKSAEFVYDIPESRLLAHTDDDLRYRFASYSDLHIDSTKDSYKYDELHWQKALETAKARKTDFIAMSGDYVNNNTISEGISVSEWRTYQRILAESDYTNPVYEGIGNHEVRQNYVTGTEEFIKGTGLEGSNGTATKGWFEKTLGGDHFLFMSMEKGFNPTRKVDQFSNEQLNWLENRLNKYKGDGNNIYVIEHALFYKYGAGDRTDDEPYYSLPLHEKVESTQKLKAILQDHKDVIFITGHTHIAFSEQYNFSDNGGTSAQMIHNSSVGGVRHIVNNALKSDYKKDITEGYIVDVYDDVILFNGANLYYNEYDPNCCYIIKPSNRFTGGTAVTKWEAEEKVPGYLYEIGNVKQDSDISVSDVTLLQRYLVNYEKLNPQQLINADANGDGKINICDATHIQKFIAQKLDRLISKEKQAQLDKELPDKAREMLKLYYRYSSYDSYQNVKRTLNEDFDLDYLKGAVAVFAGAVDCDNIDKPESTTVYFENTMGWKDVYAYNWGEGNTGNTAEMPGHKLSSVGKSEKGNKIYKYTIPDLKYNWFIFTDGTVKTKNIRFYSGNVCYYISDETKFKVGSYKYSE